MEEIKIWAIDGSEVADLKSTGQTETEKLLEDALVSRPDLLLEDLTLVGRQTSTEGGPLDLLGVADDGRLVVFELKRGTLSRDAVSQIIDYSSDLDRMELEGLANHISERSGSHGIEKIEDFQDWYIEDQGFEDLDSLKPMRMFLVGLGVDDTTERMVRFLAENSGMDISLLTFHGFTMDSKTILAKRVEVDSHDDKPTGGPPSRGERWKLLEVRVDEFGIRELFDWVRNVFKDHWPEATQLPSPHKNPPWGRNINVKLNKRTYVRLETGRDEMGIVFNRNSVILDTDAFKPPMQTIPHTFWPKKSELEDSGTEVHFSLTADDWETHKEKLTVLIQSLYEAWPTDPGA